MRKDGEGRLDKERKNVKETRENKTNRKNWGRKRIFFLAGLAAPLYVHLGC
jgi:hypothetical protein